jgi:hypothetical protein
MTRYIDVFQLALDGRKADVAAALVRGEFTREELRHLKSAAFTVIIALQDEIVAREGGEWPENILGGRVPTLGDLRAEEAKV